MRVESGLRPGLAALLLAGLLVRLAFLVLEPATRPLADERTWIELGRELAAPSVSFDPLRSDLLFYPPLHPYLIGATLALFGTLTATKLAQVLLGALLVPVVGRLGERTFGRRTGLVAAAMTAFLPELVWYSTHFWSEPLFVLLLWWGLERVLAGDESTSLGATAAGGALLGAAALTREPPIYFLPFLAAWVLARRDGRASLRALVLVALALLVVAPWTARNYARFHALVPVSTMGGRALWEGNTERPRDQIYAEWDAVGLEKGPVEQYAFARREALGEIRERQPLWLPDKLVHEVPNMLTPDNMVLVHLKRGGYGWPRPAVAWLVAAVTVVPYLATLALFVVGLARLRWSRSRVLLVGFALFYVLVHVAVLGHHRFRPPLLPVFFVIGASVLEPSSAALAPLTPRRRLVLVVLVLLVALCLVPGFLGFLREPAFIPRPAVPVAG